MRNAEGDLTPREQVLLAGVVAGKTKVQAAIDAGYPERAASQQAAAALARPQMREEFRAILAEMGLDRAGMVRKLAGLLESKTFVIDRFGARHEGPDNKAQLGALELAMKLGDYLPTRISMDVSGTIQVVTLQAEDASGRAEREPIDVAPGVAVVDAPAP